MYKGKYCTLIRVYKDDRASQSFKSANMAEKSGFVGFALSVTFVLLLSSSVSNGQGKINTYKHAYVYIDLYL